VSRAAAYAAVAKAALADRMAFRAEAFFGSAMGAARVALALVLWGAVFDGRAEVGGLGLPVVAGYYVIAVFVFQLDQSSALSGELAAEIRTGRFGKYLARPVEPLAWFLAQAAGRSAFQAAVTAGAAALAWAALAALGPWTGTLLAPLSPLGLLAALPVLAAGLVALALVNFMTGIMAFRFQDVGAFQIAKNCVVEFLSGAMVPLAMMPDGARRALGLTPFPALAALPAELALGRGWEALPSSLAVLLAWDAALYLAARAFYARLSDRYEELGS
jgi:ABC-2 type transport system permease protein